MKIRKVGIAGLGIMGTGITVTVAKAGFKVTALDKSKKALEEGRKSVEAFFSQSVKRGKLTDKERNESLANIIWTLDINELSGADAVIEAVYEDIDVKTAFFRKLNGVAKKECIFITNTSTLSVTKMAAESGRGDRVIGMHFCNPAPLMKLVEVAVAPQTSQKTLSLVSGFAEALGKTCIRNEDAPGHIVNVLLMPLWADAVRLCEQKIASAADIDTVCRLGFGYPKGPLEMIDIAGTSIMVAVLQSLYAETGEKRQRCPRILEKMAVSGLEGRKSAGGFYTYSRKGAFGTTDDEKKDEANIRENAGVKTIGVVGFGTMGRGISQSAAEHGIDVVAVDTDETLLSKGMLQVKKFINKRVEKGSYTQKESKDILRRIKTSADYSALAGCEIVMEVVFEQLGVKQDVFRIIEENVNDAAVIASNTSCIPVTQLASVLKKPERACGLHFFNPVPLMNIVEVVKAMQTDDRTIEKGKRFVCALGNTAVFCRDVPGFISNRLLIPFLFHAYRKHEEGLASVEDIDRSMELGAGFPMGPFRLSDLIGLDVLLHIGEFMYRETADPDYAPPPVLRNMLAAGLLGRKSGQGFYRY